MSTAQWRLPYLVISIVIGFWSRTTFTGEQLESVPGKDLCDRPDFIGAERIPGAGRTGMTARQAQDQPAAEPKGRMRVAGGGSLDDLRNVVRSDEQ